MKTEITRKDACLAFGFAAFMPMLLTALIVFALKLADKSVADMSIWLQYLLAQGGILAVGLVMIFYKKQEFSYFGGFNIRPKAKNAGLIVLISASLIFVMNPILTVFSQILEKMGYVSNFVTFDFATMNTWEYVAAILLMTVVPAFAEEIVYRGFVLEGFRKEKFDKNAILISALLFALMHKNVEQLLHPFVMGLVLAFVYCATESIWNTIFLHFLNNLFTMFIMTMPQVANFVSQSWWMMLVGLPVAALTLFLIYKNQDATGYITDEIKSRKEMIPELFLAAGIIYCSLVFVLGIII